MAEGVLGGLLGEADETPEALEAAPRASAEAFAASLATQQPPGDPKVARAAEHFLRRQARLIDLQAEELSEQRTLRLSHLVNQDREGRIRRAGQRIRVGMQSFLALVIGLITLGVLVMVYDAFTSRQVVVDAFRAPPALASRGVTGEVVAAGVLDTLQKLQAATRTVDKQLRTRGAWASDVKVEVPETGVSLGEIIRLLHERFGHDLHITGELVQSGSGLSLTVRGEGVPAAAFTGGPEDLAKLTAQAAEYAYGRSQPIQYTTYLVQTGRYAEAIAFDQGAFPRAGSDEERAQLANSWGNANASLNQTITAVEKYRLAMSFAKPRSKVWWKAWGNVVGSISAGEGEEAGWREAHAMLQAAAAAPKHEGPDLLNLQNPAQMTWDLPLQVASTVADAKRNSGAGTTVTLEGPALADIYALMHDPALAARYLAASDPNDSVTKAETLLIQGYAALDRGDAANALVPMEAFWKAWLADPNLQYTYNFQGCYTGLALGLAGRLKEAEAVFKRVNWSLCDALQGDVLAHSGDLAGAQKAWAEGQRLRPDLPAVPLHRGVFELSQGQLNAAEADAAAAASKAPHWADPWKTWGDVLAREGRWKLALGKYDEALKYAPAWAELHRARAAAARRAV